MRSFLMTAVAVLLVAAPCVAQAQCPLQILQAYPVLQGQRFDGIAVVVSTIGDGVPVRGQLRIRGAGGALDVVTPSVKADIVKWAMPAYRATLLVIVPISFRARSVEVREAAVGLYTTACDEPVVALSEPVTPATFDESTLPPGTPLATGAQVIPEAKLADAVPPMVPDSDRARAPSGVVGISVMVRNDGQPTHPAIALSSGDAGYDEAAWTAAKSSSFQASRWANIPVPLAYTLRYGFAIAPHANVVVPTSGNYPAPSLLMVKSLCSGPNSVLSKWNFVSPYLLCYNNAGQSEGVALFMDSSTGFTLLRHAGGVFDADYLIRQGVPSSTATALVAGLHS